MRRYRELESTVLYAGLGVQLIDEYASVMDPAPPPDFLFEAAPIEPIEIELDVEDGLNTWRALEPGTYRRRRSAGGITWFPWLEHYRDARGRAPRKYRVRVSGKAYTPLYEYDATDVVGLVHPYDDTTAPAGPPALVQVRLLPSAAYPFAAEVPIVRGIVTDTGTPVENALVYWSDATLQTERVLTDKDGYFDLPLRRAPRNPPPIIVTAETQFGLSGDKPVRIPQDLSTFLKIAIS